ncbi:MAG: hypothetical protein ACFFCS_23320 [Candidatus Hodarchaeota archaeon]
MVDKDKKDKSKKVQYVTISIKKYKKKQILEQKEKTDKDGIIEVRTHSKKQSATSEKVTYNWKTTEYRIPLFKLGLKTGAPDSDVLNVLNSPQQIVNKRVAEILKKLEKSFGGIIKDGSKQYEFKTGRFKKKRDYTPKKKVMMG